MPDESQQMPGLKRIGCSLCPTVAIPYTPGEGTLRRLWANHVDECHPSPEMVVTDA